MGLRCSSVPRRSWGARASCFKLRLGAGLEASGGKGCALGALREHLRGCNTWGPKVVSIYLVTLPTNQI